MADEVILPVQRLPVINDLGPVSKGDHCLVVAGVVVAVDTSRRPGDVILPHDEPLPAPTQAPDVRQVATGRLRAVSMKSLTSRMVVDAVREHQPVTTMALGDLLGIARKDVSRRSKISRHLRTLLREGVLTRRQDGRLRQFAYVIAGSAAQQASQ